MLGSQPKCALIRVLLYSNYFVAIKHAYVSRRILDWDTYRRTNAYAIVSRPGAIQRWTGGNRRMGKGGLFDQSLRRNGSRQQRSSYRRAQFLIFQSPFFQLVVRFEFLPTVFSTAFIMAMRTCYDRQKCASQTYISSSEVKLDSNDF